MHMIGGLAGLAGAWVVGPRIGRFNADGQVFVPESLDVARKLVSFTCESATCLLLNYN